MNFPHYAAAIVGGGASGALVAAQIGLQATVPCRVLLFDPADHFGRGLAYGTRDLTHLLNVPAGKISALPDRPGHFLDWLNREGNPVSLLHAGRFEPGEFVPRAIYGCYLASLVRETFEDLACVASLEVRQERVVDFVPTPAGGTLVTASGDTEDVGHVTLALGNLPPRDPLSRRHPFFSSPRYAARAWQPDGLKLDERDDVLLVGSGLTAVDVILALEARGHRGRYLVTSRGGRWPQPHAPAEPRPDFLADRALPASVRELFRLIRLESEKASVEGSGWRAVIDAIRPHTQELWQEWGVGDRGRFLRHARTLWECHRHRMPPSSWKSLEELRSAGRLELIPGRLQDFSENGPDVLVTLRPKGKNGVLTLAVQRVINCIGPESNFRQHFNDPLLINLLARGVLHPDPLLLGLNATPDGRPIGSNGGISEAISLIGPPLKGVLWESTAIPEIRVQALRIAENVLRDYRHPAWEI